MDEIKVKALIVVMSHLSDAQESLNLGKMVSNRETQDHINFAKYICFHVVDLSKEIDPDAMYESYNKSKGK